MNRVFNAIHSFKDIAKLVLLQPHRTVVANFVPDSFDLFRRNHWQLLAEPRVKNTVLGDCSTVCRYCVTIAWHKSSNVHCKL